MFGDEFPVTGHNPLPSSRVNVLANIFGKNMRLLGDAGYQKSDWFFRHEGMVIVSLDATRLQPCKNSLWDHAGRP